VSLKERLEKSGIELNKETHERLEIFSKLLLEWSCVHNLTGAKNPTEIEKNIFDSLYPLRFIARAKSLLDVGTGAGFPGLILATAWSDMGVLLCEPRNKRAAFLRVAALEMGLESVDVVRKRVEELRHEPFELITSRALSDTASLLSLTHHLSAPHTRYLFYKGSRIKEEIANLPEGFEPKIIQRSSRHYLYLQPTS